MELGLRSPPEVGLESGTTTSAGQRLTDSYKCGKLLGRSNALTICMFETRDMKFEFSILFWIYPLFLILT